MTTDAAPDVGGTVFDEHAAEVARSYAIALLNVADGGGEADAVVGELDELVTDVWEHQPDFARLLAQGLGDPERRDRMVARVFEGRTDPTVFKFLRVLARRDRLGLLPIVASQARALLDRRRNRVPVLIRSAVPLDDGQRDQLRQRLAPLTGGAEPILSEEVDPDLIGGLVVQVGDQRFDASVRSRLAQIRDQLLTNRLREVRRRDDLVLD